MQIQEEIRVDTAHFGSGLDGKNVDLYTIKSSGTTVEIMTYGATIVSLEIPDIHGNLADVVLGYDSLKEYMDSTHYFGATVGRYANRIANGRFQLDGDPYTLAQNNGNNHLHGGKKGFDRVVWNAKRVEEAMGKGVKMTYLSPHLEEGYPGNLKVSVTYLLTYEGDLQINYEAESDRTTIINLTNHSYFNLGSDDTIGNHQLCLQSSRFLPVNEELIPTGELRAVEGTPFDFTTLKPIVADIEADDEQLQLTGGYDHCFVLDKPDGSVGLAGTVIEPKSGRQVQIFTTEPGMQLYTGNFLRDGIRGKKGKLYGYRSGLCLETQHFPDSPHHEHFPSVILKKGEAYRSITRYAFGVRGS